MISLCFAKIHFMLLKKLLFITTNHHETTNSGEFFQFSSDQNGQQDYWFISNKLLIILEFPIWTINFIGRFLRVLDEFLEGFCSIVCIDLFCVK